MSEAHEQTAGGMELPDWLERRLAPGDVEQSASWRVEDEGAADWVVRKIRRLRRERHRLQAQVQRHRDALEAYEDEVVAPLADEEERWTGLLDEWQRRRLDEDPKARRTVALPSGRVKARKVAPRPEVEDAVELLAWARSSAPELVRVREDVDRRRLGKAAKGEETVDGLASLTPTDDGRLVHPQTGEVVPGVRMTAEGLAVSVDVIEDSEDEGGAP